MGACIGEIYARHVICYTTRLRLMFLMGSSRVRDCFGEMYLLTGEVDYLTGGKADG